MRTTLIIALIFSVLNTSAQRRINFESIQKEYEGHNAVYSNQEAYYVFDIVDDTLAIKQHNTQEMIILSNQTRAFTNDNISYNSFSSIDGLEAFTMVPRAGSRRFDKFPVNHFKESHNRETSIFYNDSKTIQFAYPSLRQGASTTLKYTVIYHNPRFLRPFYFQSYIPVMKSKVIAKVHKDIKLGYLLFNDEDYNINFRQYSRGRYNYYEWEAEDISQFHYLGTKYYNIRHQSPHIFLYIDQVEFKNHVENYYSTTDDLYQFYRDFLKEMDNNHTLELENHVDKITGNLSGKEKVKAIYYWVQENIRYVAYIDGDKGFIPASPEEVFNKRFGDCKGMSALIHKMLEIAGVSSYLSWVGTRDIPYTYDECPLPAVDNHMIVVCNLGDSTFILDGTFKFLDLNAYPHNIQGKEVLIGIDEENFEIFQVPVTPATYSNLYDSVRISISGKSVIGKGRRIHTGLNKWELAMAMDGVNTDDYPKKLSTLFQKGNNKFLVSGYEIGNLFEYDIPAEVQYEFTLDDYVIILNDEIFINLNLDRSYISMKVDTNRRITPVINDFHFTETHITAFEVPEGYRVSYIPENDAFKYDDFRFSIEYKTEGDFIIMKKQLVFEFLELFENKIPEWNQMIDRLIRNYRLTVVLEKINNQTK